MQSGASIGRSDTAKACQELCRLPEANIANVSVPMGWKQARKPNTTDGGVGPNGGAGRKGDVASAEQQVNANAHQVRNCLSICEKTRLREMGTKIARTKEDMNTPYDDRKVILKGPSTYV